MQTALLLEPASAQTAPSMTPLEQSVPPLLLTLVLIIGVRRQGVRFILGLAVTVAVSSFYAFIFFQAMATDEFPTASNRILIKHRHPAPRPLPGVAPACEYLGRRRHPRVLRRLGRLPAAHHQGMEPDGPPAHVLAVALPQSPGGRLLLIASDGLPWLFLNLQWEIASDCF